MVPVSKLLLRSRWTILVLELARLDGTLPVRELVWRNTYCSRLELWAQLDREWGGEAEGDE